ncbi:LuxR C-terminal-related transcriptional regulator [Bradyrhizobium sp. B097]|uniref:LuxR C-terminal-related transcriptional regulator n=1 Tax=Bradyrhizobium sp. B097 TaxID=3140244 RepID=UPI003183018A
MVLLQAPAGFGKTTTMAQLRERLESDGAKVAWLTLDPADNEVPRLLASLRVSLECIGKGIIGADSALPLGEAASRGASVALFLDDCEALHDPAALSIVRELIDRLSGSARIFMASRSFPRFELARQRARGRLLEISAESLRFHLSETEEYLLQARRLDLSTDQISFLHHKCEGWIAAIWLASLSLAQQQDVGPYLERLSGFTEVIAEFLAEDVVASQPEAIRQFLLRTSILRRIELPVCQALLPGMNADELLETVKKRNLFIVAAGTEPRSYRFHHLFVDFLRERLKRDHPHDVLLLHLAASTWYDSHGRPVPAIDHALEAGDDARALSLLDRHAPRLLEQGRFRTLGRWFDTLSFEKLHNHRVLAAISVWATLFTRGAHKAAKRLALIRQGEDNHAPGLTGYINTLTPLLLGIEDRYEEAVPAAKAALARLPTANSFADGVLCNAAAYLFSVAGEEAEARRLLEAARCSGAESAFVHMYSESLSGLLAFQAGRLSEAIGWFKSALAAIDNSPNDLSGNAWAGILYAVALYERNDLEGAKRLLDVYMPVALEVGLPDHVILGHAIRSRSAYLNGDIDQAFGILVSLENVGYARNLPRLVASAKLERARLFLLQDNLEAARTELDRASDSEIWSRVRGERLLAHETEDTLIGHLRMQIWTGRTGPSVCAIDEEISQCSKQGRHRRTLVLRMFKSLLLQRSGKPAAAMDVLAGVLRQASREGFMRLVLDQGEPILRLVRRFQTLQQTGSKKNPDPVLLGYLKNLVQASGTSYVGSDGLDCVDEFAEPLTPKEIEILERVAEGCSNTHIAIKVGSSETTVRTHLRNINRKLGARSRAEAVAISRRLDVIR